MTFETWYKFNFVDNKIMTYMGDMYVKLFRDNRTSKDNCALSTLIRVDTAVRLFGHLQLIRIGYHSEKQPSGLEYKALCALLCMEAEASVTE